MHCVGCMAWGAGPRVWGAGHRVQGAGCRVRGVGCRAQGAGLRVQGAGPRVQAGVSQQRGCLRGKLPECTDSHWAASQCNSGALRHERSHFLIFLGVQFESISPFMFSFLGKIRKVKGKNPLLCA